MRKITNTITHAFLIRSPKTLGNTHSSGEALFLHGNKIAEWRGNDLWITNANWFSSTTKERLNSLPNVSIAQNKGVWFLNGREWDGNWVKVS